MFASLRTRRSRLRRGNRWSSEQVESFGKSHHLRAAGENLRPALSALKLRLVSLGYGIRLDMEYGF